MLKIENIQRLDLGIQGENRARAIEIDCGLWRDLFPNGLISITHQRPGETAPDVTGATYDDETGILRWEPTNFDTFYQGSGQAEIRSTENRTVTVNGQEETIVYVKKSIVVETVIHPANVNVHGETIESNQQAYIDEVSRLQQLADSSERNALFYMNGAMENREAAKAWATGIRNGVPVDQYDETYQNSAKYHAEQASADAETAASAEAAAISARNDADRARAEAQMARDGTSQTTYTVIAANDGPAMTVTLNPDRFVWTRGDGQTTEVAGTGAKPYAQLARAEAEIAHTAAAGATETAIDAKNAVEEARARAQMAEDGTRRITYKVFSTNAPTITGALEPEPFSWTHGDGQIAEVAGKGAKTYAELAKEEAIIALRGSSQASEFRNTAMADALAAGLYKQQAGESAAAARNSKTAAANSENQAAYWANLAQQKAEESGYALFSVKQEDGCMYVTTSESLNDTVIFHVDESSGNLIVQVAS